MHDDLTIFKLQMLEFMKDHNRFAKAQIVINICFAILISVMFFKVFLTLF